MQNNRSNDDRRNNDRRAADNSISDVYNLVVTEKYTDRAGQEKSRSYTVGAAFPLRNGFFRCITPTGISLSGEWLMCPKRDREPG